MIVTAFLEDFLRFGFCVATMGHNDREGAGRWGRGEDDVAVKIGSDWSAVRSRRTGERDSYEDVISGLPAFVNALPCPASSSLEVLSCLSRKDR